MSLPISPVLREVVIETSIIDLERTNEGKVPEYQEMKDGMLFLHCAWQELLKAVRAQKDLPEAALAPALQLAAASIKFTTDLGDARWLEQYSKNQNNRKSLLAHRVKLAGEKVLTFLGLKSKEVKK